jgi:hypothetical protein
VNTVPEPSDNWAAIEGAPPTWIPLIPDFTGTPWADRAGYARQAAEWVWLAIGSQQPQDAASREQHVERLTTVILDAYESLSGKVLAHQTFLYIPGPEAPPLPALLGIWKSAGARDERLRYLAGADGHDAIQPPDVEEFSTEHLGSGLRVFSVSKPDEDSAELMGTLAYAFRSEAYQTDIQLRAPSYDLGLLQACADDVDEFARCIFVTPAPGAARG